MDCPTNYYAPPGPQHMSPTSQYVPPASQYMPPAPQHMPPAPQYMPPAPQYMPPAPPHMPPAPQHMPPTSQYMPPNPQYMPPTPQYMPPAPQYPPQQPKSPRLDYKNVPSAVDLIKKEIDGYKQSRESPASSAPANLPPLVTTLESNELQMSLQDRGCVRPCHMRSSIYQVPVSKDTLDSSSLEFSVVVKPFDEAEVDGRIYVPLSQSEKIVRCNRCRAYANPFSRNGQCCICSVYTKDMQELPPEVPELNYGSYEFRATPEYYRDEIAKSRRPHIIFAIEVTAHSKHLVYYLSKNLANVIKNYWPTDHHYPEFKLSPLVGFVTYNSRVTIYDITKRIIAYVIPDMASATECVPTTKFLVDPHENLDEIEKFLASLPEICSEDLEREDQTVLGPAIEAALATCLYDTSNYFPNQKPNQSPNQKLIPTGKIYVLHSSLPSSGDENTPGRLGAKRNLDDMRRQLGTETENKILKPDDRYYADLARRCIYDYGTGVELYLFPNNPKVYLNIATVGDLACLTGTGVVNKYHISALNNFIEDLKISLKSTMGFDASMRVRTSTGVRPVRYIGNFNHSSRDSNLEMSTVNTGSNFIVQIDYDDKIPENDLVVVQFSMIYTSVCGERRVRVHNLALTACQSYQDLYKMACCDTLMNVLIRDSLVKMRLGTLNPKTAKEQLTSRIINILTAYRRHCSEGQTGLSQLILPEGLKLLPVYLCGALKCDAIDGGMEMYPDDKVIAQINLLSALPSMSQVTIYPRLYAIVACNADDENNEHGLTASLTRCLRVIIDEDPAPCYVLENGHYLFIYFTGTDLGQSFLEGVFGKRKDDTDLFWDYRNSERNETKFLEKLLDQIVKERRRSLTISVIRQGRDKLENVFNSFLYEDKKRPTVSTLAARHDNLSYTGMLIFLHSEIRTKLSQ